MSGWRWVASRLRVDRAGIAMIVAVVLVAVGAVPIDGLTSAIHFPTLLLLGGLMILSARVGASGFYDAAASLDRRPGGPAAAPACLHHRRRRRAVGIAGQRHRGLRDDAAAVRRADRARPRSAAVSVRAGRRQQCRFGRARLIGNPQNILIGQAGNIGFWPYFAGAVVPSIVGLVDQLRLHRLHLAGKPGCARRRRAARGRSPFDRLPDRHLRGRAWRAAGTVCHAAAARGVGAAGRCLPDRQPRRCRAGNCSARSTCRC